MKKISAIAITYPDRLTRFGFTAFKEFLKRWSLVLGKIKVFESLAKVLVRKSKLLPRPLLEVTRQGVEVW